MKNVSSEYSTSGNMPASVCTAATQAGPNQGQINGHIKTETNDSMIFCNNELANSFQVLKERTGSIGHPGYYIQKALSNVTTNSRSQSLPSCLESKKSTISVPTCKPEVKSVQISVKQNKESWFRTWPERGNEKLNLLITPNNNSDLTLAQPPHSNRSRPNANCDNSSDNRSPSINNNSPAGASPKNAIPLSELLESIPLAYSPVTRQLHIMCRSGKPLDEPLHEDGGDSWPLECIEEDADESAESPRSTLHRTDGSSFSSIVSSLSDISPSTTEEEMHGSRGRDSRSSGESSTLFEDAGAKPKRRGISGFFSRSVFGWRSQPADAQPGWRLFGTKAAASPPEEDPSSRGESPCSVRSDRTYDDAAGSSSALIRDARPGPCDSPCSVRSEGSGGGGGGGGGGKRYEDVVASSSALIQHPRPASLPAKSHDEEAKHRQEYQLMVEAARKKELREAKCRKKQLQLQLKGEEQLAAAARIWNQEILPKWDTMHNSRKARDLWWGGLPPSVRGRVWQQAVGNPLNITHALYDICVERARDQLRSGDRARTDADKESSVQLIQLDIARTFPHLCIFQEGGPCYDMLHCLLGAYACYRPDVGYVQGMSFIAAVLILNLDVADAFVCFANLLNRPCLMAFFRLNQSVMQAYYAAYADLFAENLPRLHRHFSACGLTPDLYLLDWLYTVYAKAMPLDVACRVWDVYLRDGESFLLRAALGVLSLAQDTLLGLDFLHGAQYLTRLPDDLDPDQLFRAIGAVRMLVGKRGFEEVLAGHVGAAGGGGAAGS